MKNMRKTVVCMLLTFSLLISGVMQHGMVSFATGGNTTETQGKEAASTEGKQEDTATDNGAADASVSKAQSDAEDARKKKKNAQKILDKLKTNRDNLQEYVTQLDKELNEIEIEISHLEQNQKELQEGITETQKQLKEARAAQQQQYMAMMQRIQMVYESGNKGYLDVLLTATSMTDMLNKTEYVSQVSLYDYNVLKELSKAKEQVANIKQKLEKDLASNKKMQEEVNSQKSTRETLIQEKSNQIALYNESIEDQKEEVAKYERLIAQAEAIIIAAEQNASNSATSTYTGGVFVWPVPSSSQITSYFGGRESPVPGASVNHKGIDIACDTGAAIVAAASGTVIVSTYNAAEGNYICIDHGGGVVTLYMHNSQLLVSVGETVAAGQTIAAAGSTGISTGPHCHFGVRVDGVYVDPLLYLQ